jgi:hypothetical protein
MRAIVHVNAQGKKIRLYSVQLFAMAVGRDKQTIKRWERMNILPKAPFSKKRGKVTMRLYPEYFVKAVSKVMEELKIARGKQLDPIISKAKIWAEIDIQKAKEGL